MSHELEYPELIIKPEPETVFETYWYYYIPELNREYWDGVEYDDVKYDWAELDYRFGVDYPSVPEPADAGFFMAIVVAMFVGFCWIASKK